MSASFHVLNARVSQNINRLI